MRGLGDTDLTADVRILHCYEELTSDFRPHNMPAECKVLLREGAGYVECTFQFLVHSILY